MLESINSLIEEAKRETPDCPFCKEKLVVEKLRKNLLRCRSCGKKWNPDTGEILESQSTFDEVPHGGVFMLHDGKDELELEKGGFDFGLVKKINGNPVAERREKKLERDTVVTRV